MNKLELIANVAAASGLTKVAVTRAIEALVDTISTAVATGETVTLVGFGSFKMKETAARSGRNPGTGATLNIPAKKSPKFIAGKTFKDAVNV